MTIVEAVAELEACEYDVQMLADDSFGCDEADEHGAATHKVCESDREAWIGDLYLCDACVIAEAEGMG